MTITLYDLCLEDRAMRPSPFCWLVKFALLHKGLPFDTVELGFLEKDRYPDPEYGKLPVIRENDRLVRDSADILDYLDAAYPDAPLTRTEGEAAGAAFLKRWIEINLFPVLAPLTYVEIVRRLDAPSAEYFRGAREPRFGKSLEELALNPAYAEGMESALAQLAVPLERFEFFGGVSPNLSDYLAFSPLMWRRVAADSDPYQTPPPVKRWTRRMLDLFDGYAGEAKAART